MLATLVLLVVLFFLMAFERSQVLVLALSVAETLTLTGLRPFACVPPF